MRQLVPRLLLVLAAVGMGTAADEPSATLQDFEGGYAPSRWGDAKGDVAVTKDWHADGQQSVLVDPGLTTVVEQFQRPDWTQYNTLRLHVKYDGKSPGQLGLEIVDELGAQTYWNRHLNTLALKPGEQTIDIDYGGGLYRGEPTSKYRGPAKQPVDMTKLQRLAFTNNGDARLFIDRIEVVKAKRLATAGGFAFDFGSDKSPVMTSFVGVGPKLRYDESRRYGLLADGWTLSTEATWPTYMLGDGVAWPEQGFRVDLDGGDYVGLVAFERGGYWGGAEGCAYDHAALKLNGAVVTEHDFGQGAIHFQFEDVEVTSIDQICDKIIWPTSGVARIAFKAAKGANVFTTEVTHSTATPLRVAGLVIAPATAEGKAFVDEHEQLQRKAFAELFAPVDHGRRDGRTAPAKPLVVESLPPGVEVFPRDWPATPGKLPGEILAVCGQTVCVHLGVYAQKAGTVAVATTPLAAGGKTLTTARVAYGRYLPNRGQTGSVWLDINHYRPEPSFTVGPDLCRSLIVEYVVPADAAAGEATATITLSGVGAPIAVPIKVKVVPVKLATLPIPVGLFCNTPAVGPECMDDAAWWKLEESVVREQMSAGLTALTGGAGVGYDFKDGRFDGGRGAKLVHLAEKYGPILGITNYGGFFGGPGDDAKAFGAALKDLEQREHLPPHYLNCYDEPVTEAERDGAVGRTQAWFAAGIRTSGWTSEDWNSPKWVELMKASYAPAANLHDREWFAKIKQLGNHPWVYNNGNSRYATGLHLWRMIALGCEGRLDWIGFNTQGFAFNNLDGREPAAALFAAHSKLGVLETPAWLARREGLLDCRLRLSLERVAKKDDPALAPWTVDNYRADEGQWSEDKLDDARTKMLKRLDELTRAK